MSKEPGPVHYCKALIDLADTWASHDRVTHWAISMRVMGKGDFFHRLMRGADCRTQTAARVIARLSAQWPAELAWPADIPRSKSHEKADAA